MENIIPQTRQDVSYIDTIIDIYKRMDARHGLDDQDGVEQCLAELQDLPLSVCIMRLQPCPLDQAFVPDSFEILLGTGGPAWRIVGDLDDRQPSNPDLQHQDWGTPWRSVNHLLNETDIGYLNDFINEFYFGE